MADNKKVVRKFGAFSSSSNPEELAMTAKGGIAAIGTILLMLAPYLGISFNGLDFNQLAQSVYNGIISAGVVVSSCMIAFGAVRKIFYALKNRV